MLNWDDLAAGATSAHRARRLNMPSIYLIPMR